MTPTERQSKSRKARRDAGLVPKTVWLPEPKVDEILAMIEDIKAEIYRVTGIGEPLPQPPHDKHGEVK